MARESYPACLNFTLKYEVYPRFRLLPLTTSHACMGDISNNSPNLRYVGLYSTYTRRIAAIRSSWNFDKFVFDPCCRHNPVSLACSLFSRYVAHSRFAARLSVLTPFLWFIVRRSCAGGGRNAAATSRCTGRLIRPGSDIVIYPFDPSEPTSTDPRSRAGFRLPSLYGTTRSQLRTRPASETSYLPLYPAIGRQISSILKVLMVVRNTIVQVGGARGK